MKKDRGSEEYRITNNVPIVYMAQDVPNDFDGGKSTTRSIGRDGL